MAILGEFKGKDSCGFEHGKHYLLDCEIVMMRNNPYIVLYDKNSTANCPYESLDAVMRNWEF